MTKHVRRLFSFFSLLVVLTMVLAACGGSASPATSTAGTGTTPTVGTTQATATTGGTQATATTAPAVATATTAPAVATATNAAPVGKVLRVHEPVFPEDLDPQHASFTHEIAVMSLIYEGLVRLNDKLEIVPAAAEKWDI